jgi:hypothetical protein
MADSCVIPTILPPKGALTVFTSKKAVATALVAAIGAGAAVPAAQAATTTSTTRTSTYHVRVNDGILATGGNVVRVKAVVKNPEQSVRNWYSRSTIQRVVRKGVNGEYEKPYTSQGYRCVPVLNGSMQSSTAKFTCKLRGADVPTTVKLTFTVPFKQTAGN